MPVIGTLPQNSTIALRDVVDYARTFPDLTPILKAGGYVDQPAREIATTVMAALLGGGYIDLGDGRGMTRVGPFPWKWNRVYPPTFYTNGWQQDYASLITPNSIGWLEDAAAIDIFNTAQPKPVFTLEVVRDLSLVSQQSGPPSQLCWLYNRELQYGIWGGDAATVYGPSNPKSGSVYTNPDGAASPPANPITQIIDANGNYLLLTGYGTEGTTAPVAPSNASPGTAATPGTGATTAWTVLDPYGPGFRLAPRLAQTGPTYLIYVKAQQRAKAFTALSQLLDPIPDEFAPYFKQGFITHCLRHSPEKALRGKFQDEFKLWMQSLQEALGKADRERDAFGFYPGSTVMEQYPVGPIGPAWPFGPFPFG